MAGTVLRMVGRVFQLGLALVLFALALLIVVGEAVRYTNHGCLFTFGVWDSGCNYAEALIQIMGIEAILIVPGMALTRAALRPWEPPAEGEERKGEAYPPPFQPTDGSQSWSASQMLGDQARRSSRPPSPTARP